MARLVQVNGQPAGVRDAGVGGGAGECQKDTLVFARRDECYGFIRTRESATSLDQISPAGASVAIRSMTKPTKPYSANVET